MGTRTSFSFPSGNVKDQQSWISQLLSLDESEEADQISFGQHLGGVVQSLNYQFSNFILDHQVNYNLFLYVTHIIFAFTEKEKDRQTELYYPVIRRRSSSTSYDNNFSIIQTSIRWI